MNIADGTLRIYHYVAYHSPEDVTSLSSMGYITDDDRYFYAEITDCNDAIGNPFIPNHVISQDGVSYDRRGICVRGTRQDVSLYYKDWIFGLYEDSKRVYQIEYIGDMDTQRWELERNKGANFKILDYNGTFREFIKFTELPIQYYYYHIILPPFIPDIDTSLRRAYFVKYEHVLETMPLEFQLDYTYGSKRSEYESYGNHGW